MTQKTDEELSKSLQSLEGEMNQKTGDVNLEGKKVVWVEDDKFLADIIKRKFAATKCTLFYFTEGLEALEIIKKEIPDIIMLDILLPGIDGFEILEKIKSNPNTKNIPVILLSNLGQPSDIKRGKELGVTHFMIKATVTPDDIIDKIKEILSGGK